MAANLCRSGFAVVGLMALAACGGAPATGGSGFEKTGMQLITGPGMDPGSYRSDYSNCERTVGRDSPYFFAECMQEKGYSLRVNNEVTLGPVHPVPVTPPSPAARRAEISFPTGKSHVQVSQEDIACAEAVKYSSDWQPKYIACMNNHGNTIKLADGRVFQAQPIARVSAPTSSTAAVDNSDPRYRTTFDSIIRKDAVGWIANRYDAGSAKNIRSTERNGKAVELRGDYTYNDGKAGWVRIDLRDPTPCLEYWDTEGTCRPLDQSRVALLAAAMAASQKNASRSGPTDDTTDLGSSPEDHCSLGDWSSAMDGSYGPFGGAWLAQGCN
jgi:hypothetical protein